MRQKDIYLQSEGDAWFQRNLASLETKELFPEIDFLIPFLAPLQKLNLSEERIEFLEVGCGSGHRTHVLAKKLEGIGWGIDPSSEAIKFASERFGAKINDKPYELHFLKGVADKLDFVDNQFNFLHFGFCLYVIDEELIVKVISEADRVLRHGGMLSILDFDHPELIEKKNKHHKELKTFKRKHERYFLEIGYELVAKLSLTPELNVGFEIDPDNRVALYLLFKPLR